MRYQPAYWDVAVHLAEFFATTKDPAFRRPARAIELAEHAAEVASRQNQPAPRLNALICLSRVYREAGQTDKAAAAAQAAIATAQSTGNADLIAEVQTRLAAPSPSPTSQDATGRDATGRP